MKKITLMIMSIFILLSVGNITLYAEDVSNYIIMSDIAPYERYTKERDPFTKELKTIPGYWIYRNSGVLMGTDHFLSDHMDVTYKAEYQSKTIGIGIVVQVTQHAGGDSDRWLLHEVERNFRRGNVEENMISSRFRNIDSNNVFYSGLGGGHYRWLNNNVVIDISYTDLYKQKTEPIEVVKAYLVKFPSTISKITIDNAHNTQWIKDEIDRRLWLCDKWNAQFQAGKTTEKDLLYNLVRSIKVFLLYRDKYYGVAANDLKVLEGYRQSKDLASIQTKLTEYKTWWAKHKEKSISLK